MPSLDPNTAVIVASALAAFASIVGSAFAAWAVVASSRNGTQLTALVPVVAKLEQNTNSMTTEIARLSKQEGDQIGDARGRAAATREGVARAEGLKDGQAQPQTPAPTHEPAVPAAAAGEEIKIEDVDSLKLK